MHHTLLRPFLKWAGGKRQLLPALRRFYPDTFGAYVEPFVGSGAVYFDLQARGRLTGHPVRLMDHNADLIGCYRAIRDDVEIVINALETLAAGHRRTGAAHFYRVRDDQFNPLRRALFAQAGAEAYTPALAAMFIYLNRTGFNGLFRLNQQGEFNVPAGRYPNPRICDPGNLRRVAAALGEPGVSVEHAPYADILETVVAGDFVYLDPPYAPLSRTAAFTAYTASGFDATAQAILQRAVVAMAGRGCHVVLSNSTAPDIARLYDGSQEALRAGLKAHRVPARRAINSRASGRGPVEEYIIANVRPRDPADDLALTG